MSEILKQLLTPRETPIDEPCLRCGEKAMVKIQAPGWGPFGGAVECKVCSSQNTLPSFLAKIWIKVEPLEPSE